MVDCVPISCTNHRTSVLPFGDLFTISQTWKHHCHQTAKTECMFFVWIDCYRNWKRMVFMFLLETEQVIPSYITFIFSWDFNCCNWPVVFSSSCLISTRDIYALSTFGHITVYSWKIAIDRSANLYVKRHLYPISLDQIGPRKPKHAFEK